MNIRKFSTGSSLGVQWLGFWAFTTVAQVHFPGQGTKILQVSGYSRKKEKGEKETIKTNSRTAQISQWYKKRWLMITPHLSGSQLHTDQKGHLDPLNSLCGTQGRKHGGEGACRTHLLRTWGRSRWDCLGVGGSPGQGWNHLLTSALGTCCNTHSGTWQLGRVTAELRSLPCKRFAGESPVKVVS